MNLENFNKKMTSKNFIKTILKDVKESLKESDINTKMIDLSRLDALRCDIYFQDVNDVLNNNPTIKTTFTDFFSEEDEKLEIIKHLDKAIKQLKKEIKKEKK